MDLRLKIERIEVSQSNEFISEIHDICVENDIEFIINEKDKRGYPKHNIRIVFEAGRIDDKMKKVKWTHRLEPINSERIEDVGKVCKVGGYDVASLYLGVNENNLKVLRDTKKSILGLKKVRGITWSELSSGKHIVIEVEDIFKV